ncbi:M28 family peptidase [Hymenobacter lutimineralis]|uniref:M28 family peptidase n=1 Tax=Hymenobacter lutimineralis TaxID=2606448 RepID=A0A5D6V9F7_9BACT|nr:M28 family peptidase [Hymenobacter lutimineralis]TYZ12513.1 M28 family peptidase [Hymenobacter lutimineralis]
MNSLHRYAILLALAGATAQPALAQSKIKVKHKPKASQPAPSAPAPVATDWALQYAQSITQEDLRRHLTVLASDAYEGRETGEKGQKMAAEYISNRFKELGLTGPVQGFENTYLQPFTLERTRWKDAPTLTIGKQPFVWKRDFYATGTSPFSQETTVQPVFAGYGIEQDGYSDYAALGDVQGKDLIILVGEPMKDGKSGLPAVAAPGKAFVPNTRSKVLLATQKGARSVFFVNPDTAAYRKTMGMVRPYVDQARMNMLGKAETPRAGYFFVSPVLGAALLRTTAEKLREYQESTATAKQPVKSPFKPAPFAIKAARQQETFATENVLGFLEGTDKKDEILVISSHYDHLGIKNGVVFNGADDDGSGTVSVLELAEAFTKAKAEGHGPRRSILFLTVTGEEEGLFGSEYYTDHPIFPLEQTIADLNIDMVGRTDKEHEGKPNYVALVGSDKLSSELHAINEAANQKYTKLDFDYHFNDPNDPERVYYRSDHYNFAKHKIPVIFYTTGDHADYHQPTDDVEKIEFDKLQTRAQLVFYTAWELANRDNRIVVDSNKP